VFAYGVEAGLTARGQVRALPRLAPVALLGALATLALNSTGVVLDLIAIAAAVAVLLVGRRTTTTARKPLRWTWPAAIATMVTALALSVTSVSYAVLHPLEAYTAETGANGTYTVPLFNAGNAGVVLRTMSVPDAPAITVGYHNAGGLVTAVDRANVSRFTKLNLALSVPGACVGSVSVDRLVARMRVRGREVSQVVRLTQPLELPCA